MIQWLVFLSRLIVGGTFVFSGFVKAIDPYGTVYKFQDYFSAFHLDFLSSFAMLFSVALSVIEFVLGVHLLFGSYRKSTPRLIFIFLCVMTPVTLYLAIANPISDCGCFGDAVHLSNWATFFKNVLLLIIVLFLVYRNTSLRALYNQQVQWLTGLYSLLFVFFFVYIGTYYQPYLDFRPYKIGVNIPEALAVEEPEREFVFIYEKNGERKEFLLDNLPSEEEGWVFVDRYEKTVSGQESVTPIIEDFTIYRGATDITEDIIYDENYRVLLLSPDLETADDSEVDRINELYDYCVERGYEFACVTASTPQGVEAWQENTGAEYPFYFMDKTVIRTIARGNPCVLLLKGGTILRKTSPSQLPDETLLVQPLDKLTYGQPEIYPVEVHQIEVCVSAHGIGFAENLPLVFRGVVVRVRHAVDHGIGLEGGAVIILVGILPHLRFVLPGVVVGEGYGVAAVEEVAFVEHADLIGQQSGVGLRTGVGKPAVTLGEQRPVFRGLVGNHLSDRLDFQVVARGESQCGKQDICVFSHFFNVLEGNVQSDRVGARHRLRIDVAVGLGIEIAVVVRGDHQRVAGFEVHAQSGHAQFACDSLREGVSQPDAVHAEVVDLPVPDVEAVKQVDVCREIVHDPVIDPVRIGILVPVAPGRTVGL